MLILHFVGIETTSESGAYRTMEKPVPAIGPAFKRSIPVEGDENVILPLITKGNALRGSMCPWFGRTCIVPMIVKHCE